MEKPGVGLGVILTKGDSILLGKRKNSHGEGTWSFPGGKLEFYEQFINCAKREVKEETDIDIEPLPPYPIAITNDFFKEENQHWVTIYMRARTNQEPKIMEPKKCEKWDWFDWNYLPNLNLFVPVKNLIKQNYNPFRK